MLEKDSKNVKCQYCDKEAVDCISGYPVCVDCLSQKKYKKDQDIQQLFEVKYQGSLDGE